MSGRLLSVVTGVDLFDCFLSDVSADGDDNTMATTPTCRI
ncbi:hypothetical protein JL2886_02122 [Phaeobacter gallaeciensis]|uniref:Uncharacterized protein n=1 Tax=Phaeobacter gallaeciensis TaxID=60890 RepID=A0A1B0ZS81_9RHOB|nr:hypothetical protein JL2886_02122 [Phaeobacter gallaeciensis]